MGERSLRVWILILGRREGQSRARGSRPSDGENNRRGSQPRALRALGSWCRRVDARRVLLVLWVMVLVVPVAAVVDDPENTAHKRAVHDHSKKIQRKPQYDGTQECGGSTESPATRHLQPRLRPGSTPCLQRREEAIHMPDQARYLPDPAQTPDRPHYRYSRQLAQPPVFLQTPVYPMAALEGDRLGEHRLMSQTRCTCLKQ